MARTPDGPAKAKKLRGITGQGNIGEPTEFDLLQIPEDELLAFSFSDWLEIRKRLSWEALANESFDENEFELVELFQILDPGD